MPANIEPKGPVLTVDPRCCDNVQILVLLLLSDPSVTILGADAKAMRKAHAIVKGR